MKAIRIGLIVGSALWCASFTGAIAQTSGPITVQLFVVFLSPSPSSVLQNPAEYSLDRVEKPLRIGTLDLSRIARVPPSSLIAAQNTTGSTVADRGMVPSRVPSSSQPLPILVFVKALDGSSANVAGNAESPSGRYSFTIDVGGAEHLQQQTRIPQYVPAVQMSAPNRPTISSSANQPTELVLEPYPQVAASGAFDLSTAFRVMGPPDLSTAQPKPGH